MAVAFDDDVAAEHAGQHGLGRVVFGGGDDGVAHLVGEGGDRRREDGQGGVDPGVARAAATAGRTAMGWWCRPGRSGWPTIELSEEGSELVLHAGVELGDVEAGRLAGVGGEDAGAPALPTMAILRPAGRGWVANTWATSNSSRRLSTRMDPALQEEGVDRGVGGGQSGGVDQGGPLPGSRPAALHGHDGLVAAQAAGHAGEGPRVPEGLEVEQDDRRVGSSSQYWMRSLPLTSALLPAETKVDTPRPRRAISIRMIAPRPPDWEMNPIGPLVGAKGEKVAFMLTAGSVLTTPRQLGPIMRIWRVARRSAAATSITTVRGRGMPPR